MIRYLDVQIHSRQKKHPFICWMDTAARIVFLTRTNTKSIFKFKRKSAFSILYIQSFSNVWRQLFQPSVHMLTNQISFHTTVNY